MPLFRYEVVDRTGKTLTGVMNASSDADVRQALISNGYVVNEVFSTTSPGQRGSAPPTPAARAVRRGPSSRVGVPPGEMVVFFRSMASFLHAGMSIFDGLTRIAAQTPNRGMRIIADRMASRVQAGERLSEAMTEFPRAFPPHVIGVTAAGELGGFLSVVIGDIALDYELAQRATSRWMAFINRLLWVNGIGMFVIAPFMPTLFSPGTESFEMGVQRYLQFVLTYVVPPLVVLIGGYHITKTILRQPSMRATAHSFVLKTPGAVRQTSITRSLASFTRMLWRLQAAGILPIQAWDAASHAAENTVIGIHLQEQIPGLRSGMKFSDALASSGYFSGEDTRVLAAGEMSGQTADVLQRIASHYEDAAENAASRQRWYYLRGGILVSILGMGAVAIGIALYYSNMFAFVDSFMGLD